MKYSLTYFLIQQIDLQQVVQRLANQGSSEEIFHSLVDRAINLYTDGSSGESVVNELCSQEGLVQVPVLSLVLLRYDLLWYHKYRFTGVSLFGYLQEFMEMLYRDISRRFDDDMGS